MHVITSLWEGSTTFCYFVSGFADFTARHNKTDGSSDIIGQKQCVKVNGRGKAARQGREITHGMMFKGGLQAEWGEELPESLVWGRWRQEGIWPQGMRRWNKEESPSESTFQSQTLMSCLTERMLSHPFKQLYPLSRTGHRFTGEVAPDGCGCPGQHPEQGSAGKRERIFQVSPL